jgi:hypothetical protein
MNLILANFIVAISLVFVGFANGGLTILAAWLGLGFLFTGFGYANRYALIYGKKKSGAFPFWSLIIFLPFFLYALVIWHFVQLLIRENAFDWITENLVIGRRLSGSEYPVGIDNFVDLTAEFWEPRAIVNKYNYVSLPILDGEVPSLEQINASLALLKDGKTYIHCGQGHGRTGLFAAMLLLKQGIVLTPDEAIALLKSRRPKLTLTAKQKQFLRAVTEHDLLS